MAIRKILVPIDFSPHATAALDLAIELARPSSAKLYLLHAYSLNVMMGYPESFVLPPDFVEQIRAAALAQLEPLEKRVARSGLSCEVQLAPTSAMHAILEAADGISADLIVMGTRGLTGLKHAMVGSVAERVVRLAHCPVLTVKAPGDH